MTFLRKLIKKGFTPMPKNSTNRPMCNSNYFGKKEDLLPTQSFSDHERLFLTPGDRMISLG